MPRSPPITAHLVPRRVLVLGQPAQRGPSLRRGLVPQPHTVLPQDPGSISIRMENHICRRATNLLSVLVSSTADFRKIVISALVSRLLRILDMTSAWLSRRPHGRFLLKFRIIENISPSVLLSIWTPDLGERAAPAAVLLRPAPALQLAALLRPRSAPRLRLPGVRPAPAPALVAVPGPEALHVSRCSR